MDIGSLDSPQTCPSTSKPLTVGNSAVTEPKEPLSTLPTPKPTRGPGRWAVRGLIAYPILLVITFVVFFGMVLDDLGHESADATVTGGETTGSKGLTGRQCKLYVTFEAETGDIENVLAGNKSAVFCEQNIGTIVQVKYPAQDPYSPRIYSTPDREHVIDENRLDVLDAPIAERPKRKPTRNRTRGGKPLTDSEESTAPTEGDAALAAETDAGAETTAAPEVTTAPEAPVASDDAVASDAVNSAAPTND